MGELQNQNFDIPNYPTELSSEQDIETRNKYDKVIGSAVNPVLREGNSDRRVAKTVKNYAKNNPHRVGAWSSNSKTHVSHMSKSDFFENEQSKVIQKKSSIKIILLDNNGKETIIRDNIKLEEKEIVDVSFMEMK